MKVFRVGLLAISVLSMTLGCSQPSRTILPTAPEPVVPDQTVPVPPLGTMLATIDGVPWASDFTVASIPILGDMDRLMVLGHGERMQLQLDLPGQLPDTGTYVLSDRPAGVGFLFVLHAEGWYLYDTGSRYTGYATITHVDSLSIAGRFGFVASAGYRGAPSFYSVRSGAFNVPISHDLATGPARELSATPLRGR